MIVDADAHLLEYLPLVREIAVEEAGESVASAMMSRITERSARTRKERETGGPGSGVWRGAWWGAPAENSLDLATVVVPDLMYSRLDELGIDYQIIYPSLGLLAFLEEDEEIRRLMARSFNRYIHEVLQGKSDRMLAGGVIPMHSPEEAVAELEYATGELGLRTVIMTGVVPRRSKSGAQFIDCVALNSTMDYDAVWSACSRLRIAPTFHGTGMGWGSRTSPQNYVFNHLGSFAAANEATCRSVIIGGAASRFEDLNWIFLEGGVTWAAQLRHDLVEHYEKRGPDAIRQFDPQRIDTVLVQRLYSEYASGRLSEFSDAFLGWPSYLTDPADGEDLLDDFASSGIMQLGDIDEIFSRFFFGCEADDTYGCLAFDERYSPGSPKLRALFSSDIGHWDVPNAVDVVPSTQGMVESGLLGSEDFAAFTYGNTIRAHGGMREDFFRGTRVSEVAEAVLSPQS